MVANKRMKKLDYEKFIQVNQIEISNKIKILCNKILQQNVLYFDNQLVHHVNCNATERYLALLRNIPKIATQIPQKEIARTIGISAVQLSRIKNKINKETKN